ncbi:MAG: hypothetical protein WCP28_00305 [Actinomycetes bacterium]
MLSRPDYRILGILVLISVAVGLVVGVVWARVATPPQVRLVDGALIFDRYSADYVANDLKLGMFCALAGVVLVVVALLLWRSRPMGVLLGLVIGGLVGSVVAWRFGVQLTGGSRQDVLLSVSGQPDNVTLTGPIELHALGVLLLWSLVGTVVVVIFNAFRTSRARQQLLDEHGLDVKANPTVLALAPEPPEG